MADLWLKHPKTGVVWLVTHEDTQKRCLSEGFTLAADPRLPLPAVAPAVAPDPEPPEASAPSADTPMAESADELATQAELAALADLQARNRAARTAFGVTQPPEPAPNVRRGLKQSPPPATPSAPAAKWGTTHGHS